MSQQEVEAAWGLKPVATPRPTDPRRPVRSAPRRGPSSLTEKLLRLVLQRPFLAARVPLGLISADNAEGRALIGLIDAVDVGDIAGNSGLGAVLEQFRDSPHSEVLARQAESSAEEELDDSVMEVHFQAILSSLRQECDRREIDRLTEKASLSGLSPDETNRYRDLLHARKEPSKPTTVSDS